MGIAYNWTDCCDSVTMTPQRKDASDVIHHFMMKTAYARKLRGEENSTVYSKRLDGYVDPEEIKKLLFEIGEPLLSESCADEQYDEYYFFFFLEKEATFQCNINNGRVYLELHTLNKEFFNKSIDLFSPKFSEVPPQGNVMMLANEGNFYLTSIGVISSPLNRCNYTPSDIETYDSILEDLKSDSPLGRLILLSGEPGTGKSYFIKGLISEGDALFVFIPASLIGEISAPHLTPVLLQHRSRPVPIVLIMEDADATLVSRQIDNVSKLSELLNISDGILGDLADVRVIATTNAEKPDIDPALLREGRLSHFIKFEALPTNLANKAYENITGDKGKFSTKKVLSNIYQEARLNGWLPTKGSLIPKRRYHPLSSNPRVGF